MAFFSTTRTSSFLNGLVMYSWAPCFIASTADSTDAKAVTMMTGSEASISRSCCMVSMPSIPGIIRSTMAQS